MRGGDAQCVDPNPMPRRFCLHPGRMAENSPRPPDAVENPWSRSAAGRPIILPLLGGEGRGEGEPLDHSISSPAEIRAAGSGGLGLFSVIPAGL